MIRRLFVALPILAATSCAPTGTTYPSLARRAVEGRGFAEPVVPVAPVMPDPALDAQMSVLAARLDSIGNDFAAAAATAQRRAAGARGKPAGSEPWLEAQTALAALDDWRAQISALATDVEQLAIARAATLAPPYPAVTALSERADAEVRRQGETIARIQAMLAPA